MFYQVCLLRLGEPPASSFIYRLGTIRGDSDQAVLDSALVSELSAIVAESESVAGYLGREVLVLEIDDDVHQQWVAGQGDAVKSRAVDWKPSKPVEVGQRFQNARKASEWLGFNHNDVSTYLTVASKKHTCRKDRVAKLRGVTLIYRDDYLGAE